MDARYSVLPKDKETVMKRCFSKVAKVLICAMLITISLLLTGCDEMETVPEEKIWKYLARLKEIRWKKGMKLKDLSL